MKNPDRRLGKLICLIIVLLLPHLGRQGHFAAGEGGLARAQEAAAPESAASASFISQIGGPSDAVDVVGNTAYVAAGGRLEIVNISNPGAPQPVGKTPYLSGAIHRIEADPPYV